MRTEAGVRVMPLLGGNQEPRDASCLWKLDNTRKQFVPGAPADMLISAPSHTSDLENYKIINMCYIKPLRLQ